MPQAGSHGLRAGLDRLPLELLGAAPCGPAPGQKISRVMSFPFTRLRRLRQSPSIRDWVSETSLSPKNLIYPLFVRPGRNVRKPMASMAGPYQISVDHAVKAAKECKTLGIAAVSHFGIHSNRDEGRSTA